MYSSEILPLKVYHLGQMSRLLRHEHAKMILNMNYNVHRSLLQYYNLSLFSRAWKVNGKLAGVGGVTGSLLSTEGYIWLALSEEILKNPIIIVKEAVMQLREILKVKKRLIAFVLTADKVAQRFAEFLGFVSKGLCADPNFIIYSLEAEV